MKIFTKQLIFIIVSLVMINLNLFSAYKIENSSSSQIDFTCFWNESEILYANDLKDEFVLVIPPLTNFQPEITDYEILHLKEDYVYEKTISKNDAQLLTKMNIAPDVSSTIKIQELGYARFNRLIKVTVNARLKTINNNEHFFYKNLKGIIKFDQPYSSNISQDEFNKNYGSDYFYILKSIVSNPDLLIAFIDKNPSLTKGFDGDFRLLDELRDFSVKCTVNKNDLYKINGKDLLEHFKIKNCPVSYIQIFNKNQPVPIHILDDNADGIFDPEDSITFFGMAESSNYTRDNVYWISIHKIVNPLRISSAEISAPQENLNTPSSIENTIIFEKDEEEYKEGEVMKGQIVYWLWQEIKNDKPFDTSFNLDNLSDENLPAEISIDFYVAVNKSDNKKIVITLNDILKKELPLTKTKGLSEKIDIPANTLKKTDNKIKIELITQKEQVQKKEEEEFAFYLDKFLITYKRNLKFEKDTLKLSPEKDSNNKEFVKYELETPQYVKVLALDITDKNNPKQIPTQQIKNALSFSVNAKTNKEVLLKNLDNVEGLKFEEFSKSKITETTNQANLIIIYHPLFIEAVEKLAEFKKSQNITTQTVNIFDIYNEFNYGIFSPEAIKRFIAYVFKNWSNPKPSNIILFGDSSRDYLGNYRNDVINYVPIYLIGEQRNVYASEYWFVTCLGNDNLPDMNIGRISVNNKEDANNIVEKIINYSKANKKSDWRARLSFISDDSEGFSAKCEVLINQYTTPIFDIVRIYLENFKYEDNFYVPKEKVHLLKQYNKVSPDCNNVIFELFQKGSSIMEFYGHGAPNIWADERIWFGGDSKYSDNLRLSNADKLPLIINMTCSTGAIDFPEKPWNICIGEDTLRTKNGGAIALYSPTGDGFTRYHFEISKFIRNAIFKNNLLGLGDILTQSYINYVAYISNLSQMDMFILLGDPTLKLSLPDKMVTFKQNNLTWNLENTDDFKFTIDEMVPDINSGKCFLNVTSPNNKKLVDNEEIKIINGKIQKEITLPKGSSEGNWMISAYCVDETQSKDALGGAVIHAETPKLNIKDLSVVSDEDSLKPNTNLNIGIILENANSFDLKNVELKLIETYPINNELHIETIDQIKANEYKIFRTTTQLNKGIHILSCNVKYENKMRNHQKEIVVFPDSDAPDLAISPISITLLDQKAFEDDKPSFTFKIYNLSNQDLKSPQVKITDENNSEICTVDSITSISKRSLASALAHFNNPIKKGSYKITISTQPESPLTDNDSSDNMYAFDLKVYPKPDLAIPPEDITFDDNNPTEGFTVFINATVHNLGEGPAENVKVEGYEKNPDEGGRLMKSRIQTVDKEPINIEPQGSHTFTIRWDSVDNAGINNLYFKVYSIAKHSELNEKNNIAMKTMNVKKKFDIAAEKLKFKSAPEEQLKSIVHLIATIKNIGETDAKGITVRFYKEKEQTDENFLGEIIVSDLKAGETKEVEFIWQGKEEEKDKVFHPSYNAGLISSAQLAKGYSD